MTSKLKCPFCQQELKHEKTTGIYCCSKTFIHCPLGLGTGAFGTKELWQALIKSQQDLEESQQATLENAQTVLEIHKDLEIATNALKDFSIHPDDSVKEYARKILKQIDHIADPSKMIEHKEI